MARDDNPALCKSEAARCGERLSPAVRTGESLHKAWIIGEAAAGSTQGSEGKSRGDAKILD